MEQKSSSSAMPVRRKYRFSFSKFLWLFLILFSIQSQANSWTGDSTVCVSSIENYTYNTTDSIWNWQVSPAAGFTNIFVNEISVSWGTAGSYRMIVKYSHTGIIHYDTLMVTVGSPTQPTITALGGVGCIQTQSTGEGKGGVPPTCFQVCDHTGIRYVPDLHAGSTYTWHVTGAIGYSLSGDTINVTWGAISTTASITLYETNRFGCMDSVTDCVVIVARPSAHFTTTPAAINDTVNICLNSPVTFYSDTSSNIINRYWTFGNGTTAQGQIVTENYATAGNYLASLIVESECHCRDTSYVWIHVDSLPGATIHCPCTKCHNDTTIYWTDDTCSSSFSWGVSGGAIIGPNNTDTIQVLWGDGNSGYGTVSLTTNCNTLCPATSVIRVPIVPRNAAMTGDSLVCVNTPGYVYTVPQVPSTLYTWSITGSASASFTGQYSNQITVWILSSK